MAPKLEKSEVGMAEYSRLEDIAEIEDWISKSHDKPVVFFKHSLTCPISTAGFNEYEKFLANRTGDSGAHYTLVEIQKARPVSQEITDRTGVKHESPQALVVRHGSVTWHASHWSIRADALADAVDQAG